jgi:hypothetical protein
MLPQGVFLMPWSSVFELRKVDSRSHAITASPYLELEHPAVDGVKRDLGPSALLALHGRDVDRSGASVLRLAGGEFGRGRGRIDLKPDGWAPAAADAYYLRGARLFTQLISPKGAVEQVVDKRPLLCRGSARLWKCHALDHRLVLIDFHGGIVRAGMRLLLGRLCTLPQRAVRGLSSA